MAKKEEKSKTILERVYVIPLRKETLKVPPFKKANKAAKSVREFISKHMKSDNVAIGKYLNLKLWSHGAKNPPHKVKVNAVKDDKGKVFVELVDAPKETQKVDESKKTVKIPEPRQGSGGRSFSFLETLTVASSVPLSDRRIVSDVIREYYKRTYGNFPVTSINFKD